MPIPLLNLDNRTYADLVEEMRALIPRYASDNWTNHNVSDPGITLLELFAWLTEALIYRLNRIPEASQARLLELLGPRFQLAQPAMVNLTVTATTDLKDDLILPYGTRLIACTGQGGMSLPFETVHDLKLIPPELKGNVQARQIDRVEDEFLGISDGQAHQHFGLVKAGLVQAFLAANSNGAPLGLEVKVGGRPWTYKESLLDLSAADFIVEPLPGLILPTEEEKATASYGARWGIRFGDGSIPREEAKITARHGSLGTIPPEGAKITASYGYTFGQRGNVSSPVKFEIDYGSPRLSYPVKQALYSGVLFSFEWQGNAADGKDPIGLAEAQDQVTRDLKTRWRAVTQKDFEGIREEAKKQNLELNLARIKCLPLQDLTASDPDTPRAGHVSIIAVPRQEPKEGQEPKEELPKPWKLPHQSAVERVVLSPDRTWLAVVSDSGKVEIWDVRREKKAEFWDEPKTKWVSVLPLPHRAPFPVTFSPEGRWLVAGSSDNTIRVWGSRFLFSVKLEFASDLDEGVLSMRLRREFEAHMQMFPSREATEPKPDPSAGFVRQMSLSPDATTITEEKGKLWRIDDKSQVYYAVRRGEALDIYDADRWEPVAVLPHKASVRAVAFRQDERRLVTASDRTVRIWDIRRRETVMVLPHEASVAKVRYEAHGRWLATVSDDNKVRIWDTEYSEPITVLPHNDPVTEVAFRPDGRRLATVAERTVHLWNAQTKRWRSLFSYNLELGVAEVSPDLRWLVTVVDKEDHAQVWDLDKREEITVLRHQAPIKSARFSLDGRRVATVSSDADDKINTIRVWDVPTGGELAVLPDCDASKGIEFSPDGRWLATIGQDRVQVWQSEYIQSTEEFLDGRRLLTSCHHVVGPTYTEIGIRAEVVHLPRLSTTELQKKIEVALRGFFNPLEGGGPEKQGWPFGRDVYASEIYQVIENIEGVDHVELLTLRTRGAYALTVNEHGDGLAPSAENKLWQDESDVITIAPDKLVHFVCQPEEDIKLRAAGS
ncbi:MAG: type VI secretion system baseplate subunit TssF [Anaerolineae bacterium]|nr:type VI secretion system baseplate subunit TssF [Anaerolineae bacterium]